MRTELLLLADYANVSCDGKLNVMGVFQSINASSFPAVHPTMYLVLKMVAELGEPGQTRDITIKMVNADGKELLVITGEAELPDAGNAGAGMPEVNTIIQLRDVLLPEPGSYAFVIIVDKDHKAQLPFRVNLV